MNIMHEDLSYGRNYRLINVLDDFRREWLGIVVVLSLRATRGSRSLERVIDWRGRTKAISCDNGPEHPSRVLQKCFKGSGIRIDYVQPGQPQKNPYVERLNRAVSAVWLARNILTQSKSFRMPRHPVHGSSTTVDPVWR